MKYDAKTKTLTIEKCDAENEKNNWNNATIDYNQYVQYLESAENLVISGDIKEIPKGMFDETDFMDTCEKSASINTFKNLIIEDGVEKIGESAFGGNNFESIQIPDSVKIIDEAAFYEVSMGHTDGKYGSVFVPSSVEKLGNHAFAATEMESISVPESPLPPNNKWEDSVFIGSLVQIVEIRETEKSDDCYIPDNSFHNCIALKTVYLPKNVCALRDWAFYNCCDLENIDLSNMSSISERAVANCFSLDLSKQDLSNLEELGLDTFESCHFSNGTITLPQDVTRIPERGGGLRYLFDNNNGFYGIRDSAKIKYIDNKEMTKGDLAEATLNVKSEQPETKKEDSPAD